MNHVLLPSRPRLQPFSFPLLCEPVYERGDWQSYPEQHGYQITGEISGDFQIFKTTDGTRQDISEHDVAVAVFFQQWLWFGILLEMLEIANAVDFVQENSDGSRSLTTVKLQRYSQQWVDTVSDRLSESPPEAVHEWGIRRWHLIRRARILVCRYHESYDCTPDDINAINILAIALLCEHLHEALNRIYHRTTPEDPWDVIPYFNWRDEGVDCAMPIVEKLTLGGWCPRTLAGMGINATKIETLWFYANLEAPQSTLGHQGCSAAQCVHLQVDQKKYRTKHVRPECKCKLVGPDASALAEVVLNGKLPLTRVVFGTAGQTAKVDVQPRKADTRFVAISHVWADGHGNPDGNILPSCFLKELQTAVDGLAGSDSVLFWMDTLSVPREPRSVRKQALKRLRDPYEHAAHVLVLDAYLQTQKSQNCSMIELMALVNVSSWAQRLWTFQEGRLAKDIWLQFLDDTVCMSDGSPAVDAMRSEVISEVPSDIIAFHSSTKSTDSFWNTPNMSFTSINALRSGVRLRSTSVATDEPLCLGSIVGLDMEKILDQPEAERMDVFWKMVPSIPASMGLSKASLKLERKGLRWAPASLMGDIEHNDWDGPSSMLGEVAELSQEGLICQLSALKFPSKKPPGFTETLKALYSVASNADHEFYSTCRDVKLRMQDGEWLSCDFEEAWHQTPIEIDVEDTPAILLEQPILMLPSSRSSENSPGDNISALFVTCSSSRGGNSKQVHGVQHCSLYRLSRKQCAFLEELDTVTHTLMNDHWDAVTAKQGDWGELLEFLESVVPEYVLHSSCLQVGKEALMMLRGTDDVDDQAILDNAVGTIAAFCYIGPNRYVENGDDPERWVID